MHLRIKFEDDELERFGNMAGALGPAKTRVGLCRAISRVVDMAETRVARKIAKQSSIPLRLVRQHIRKEKPKQKDIGGPLVGAVISSGKPISLREFKPVQFSWGVRVKAWGSWQRYEGSFIHGGRWNSGKLAFSGHVMTRKGKERFPVRQENGPSVPKELLRDLSAQEFDQLVRAELPKRAMHELTRLMNA